MIVVALDLGIVLFGRVDVLTYIQDTVVNQNQSDFDVGFKSLSTSFGDVEAFN
jgi:hypothetical protein